MRMRQLTCHISKQTNKRTCTWSKKETTQTEKKVIKFALKLRVIELERYAIFFAQRRRHISSIVKKTLGGDP